MQEINLVADILIAMKEGIKSKKQVRKYYATYEKEFEGDTGVMASRFDRVINKIGAIYPEGLTSTEFSRPHLFYSLFTTIAHCMYGLPEDDPKKDNIKLKAPVSLVSDAAVERARNGLDRVGEIYEAELDSLNRDEQQFMQDSRRATTDEAVRKRRTNFLLGLLA